MYTLKYSLPPATPLTPQQMMESALSHHQAGRLPPARALYEQVLRLQPQHADALHLLGVIEHSQGNPARAIERFEQSIAVNPALPAARLNLGNALRACGRLDEALLQYNAAIELNPSYVNALVARSVVLDELDRWDESLLSFEAALNLQSDAAVTYFNRGNGFRKRQHLAQAVADYDRALTLQPEFAQALLNRGSTHHALLQLKAALADFDVVLGIAPDNADAHFNKALTLLLQGNYADGFLLHEWRWKTQTVPGEVRNFHQPLWLGKPSLQGKTILLHSEQGLGDSIQFARYTKALATAGAKVVLEVPIPLAGLLRRVDGVDTVVCRGDLLPAFDVHCPLLSLPLALGTRVETIPAAPQYIRANPERTAFWSQILGPRKAAQRVGLVWSGSTWHANDRNRSIALSQLLRHLPVGPEYVSLQREVRECDRGTLTAATHLRHYGERLTDFEETAALCALMDVVVSVDTSVAHLAGAIGCPTLLLLPHVPDWRWFLNREDSPWYPSMQLLRQDRPGDWEAPLQRVAKALTAV